MLTKEQIQENIRQAMRRNDGDEVRRWNKVAEMNGITFERKKPEKKLAIHQCPLLVYDKVLLG